MRACAVQIGPKYLFICRNHFKFQEVPIKNDKSIRYPGAQRSADCVCGPGLNPALAVCGHGTLLAPVRVGVLFGGGWRGD